MHRRIHIRLALLAMTVMAAFLPTGALAVETVTTPTCDCQAVWGMGFAEDNTILSNITQALGGQDFCTQNEATCATYCNNLLTSYKGSGFTSGESIAGFPAPPVVACGSFQTNITAEDCKKPEFKDRPECKTAGTGTTPTTPTVRVVKLENPLGVKTIPELVNNILTAVLGFVGALALLMFIYGGLLWLTSGGSADKVNKGKQVMVWASIGLVIIFSSYGLVRFVFGAFSRL